MENVRGVAVRPKRADARRNEQILLDAAAATFVDRGVDAPVRDIAARAIDSEMKTHGVEHVYLDVRHLDYEEFLKHFPNINQYCLNIGIDVRKDMIPVVPAQHYMCGGIMCGGIVV